MGDDAEVLNRAFGTALKRLRIERTGLSQEKLAHKGGLSGAFVGKTERGHYNPSHEAIWKLADALGVRPHELLIAVEGEVEAAKAKSRRRGH